MLGGHTRKDRSEHGVGRHPGVERLEQRFDPLAAARPFVEGWNRFAVHGFLKACPKKSPRFHVGLLDSLAIDQPARKSTVARAVADSKSRLGCRMSSLGAW